MLSRPLSYAFALVLVSALFACEPRLMVGADCEPCKTGEMCHPELLLCVRCKGDADCQKAGQPFCDPMTFECVQCTVASQCSRDTPVCLEGACRPCEVDPSACESTPVLPASDAGTDAMTPEDEEDHDDGHHRTGRRWRR